MQAGAPVTYRFVPTTAGLDAFFRRYEQQRLASGMSSTLLRVSPSQRIDTIVTILGLNKASGWHRQGEEPAETVWLRYLTPVLAETRESAMALAFAAAEGLPGAFEPAIAQPPPPPTPPPRPLPPLPPRPAAWRVKLAVMRETLERRLRDWRVVAAMAAFGLIVAAGIAARATGLDQAIMAWLFPAPVVCCVGKPDPNPIPDPPPKPVPVPAPDSDLVKLDADDPIGSEYRAAIALTLAAVEQHSGSLTPRGLARIYAGESDTIDQPEIFLTAMLKRWPEQPDRELAIDEAGARALLEYAAVFASLESGRRVPMLSLGQERSDEVQFRERLQRFTTSESDFAQRRITTPTWPAWPRWLVFLPLLPALLIGTLTFRAAVKASLTNPPPGMRGEPVDLPLDGLILSAPPPERRLARQMAWKEPIAGRRLHADRSVRATIARGGYLMPVMRRRRYPAEYVFLVPRRRPDDHERDRVGRFIDALAGGGLSVQAYDYDPDPRSLTPRQQDDVAEATNPLDLRGLRERHPDARLVIVSDGSELVDYFTLKPLPFVADELSTWPARMLLTPVPMAEWGEREMNLADALRAPIGRATPDGFRDLATAFGDRQNAAPRAVAAPRGVDASGLVPRILAWLTETERTLGVGDGVAPRPSRLRFDDPMLRSDAPPTEADQIALVSELRAWLGSRSFHWLAACAAYPQLRFAVTIYLGLKITLDYGAVRTPLYNERLLAQLTLLPWFRTGHMPPWLRTALLDSLTDRARSQVRQAVDAMLKGTPVLPEGVRLPREARLPIWRPEVEGLDIPPDAVMADLMMREDDPLAPVVSGNSFEQIFGPHARRALAMRIVAMIAVTAWCGIAWWLWPALADAPLPQGAWLPLIALGLSTGVVFLSLLLWRSWRHNRLPEGSLTRVATP